MRLMKSLLRSTHDAEHVEVKQEIFIVRLNEFIHKRPILFFVMTILSCLIAAFVVGVLLLLIFG